jgi:nicotinamidase-related amidase/type 1 glutamine amidotransferase
MTSAWVSWLPAPAAGVPGAREPDSPGVLTLTARYRERYAPGDDCYEVREKALRWQARKTAIIICDMWERHWCKSATRRVAAMAPGMNEVVAAARARGLLVIHAPSGCMDAYRDTPQRRRAREAPAAADAPADIQNGCRRIPGEPPLPVDDSDGGCDCEPQCRSHRAWSRQIAALEIAAGDAISDSGREIWNLLQHRGIQNVILMGVHTNMCVLGRPFGLRQMAKNGKHVVLVRDLTDSMYNPRKAPYVCHRRGTELVVQHIEKHVCPSILADDINGDPRPPRVVFVIGEKEYRTRETLPAFARKELEPRGVRSTFVHVSEKDPNDFPGLEALEEADLLVLSVRRRTPPSAQLAAIRGYLEAGRPLVGIRTASHAFDRDPPAGHARWAEFDSEVLGHDYEGHYGNKPPEGPWSRVKVLAEAARHPILASVTAGEFKVRSHLYRARSLSATATPLMVGRMEGRPEREPVAIANTYKGGRIFYTSLGAPEDFELEPFRRLLLNAIHWAMEKPAPGRGKAPVP